MFSFSERFSGNLIRKYPFDGSPLSHFGILAPTKVGRLILGKNIAVLKNIKSTLIIRHILSALNDFLY